MGKTAVGNDDVGFGEVAAARLRGFIADVKVLSANELGVDGELLLGGNASL